MFSILFFTCIQQLLIIAFPPNDCLHTAQLRHMTKKTNAISHVLKLRCCRPARGPLLLPYTNPERTQVSSAIKQTLRAVEPTWREPTRSWRMTLWNSWHSLREGRRSSTVEMVLCIVGESVSKTSPHCSLSPRWLFSNVNGWLTVRGRREGRLGGRYSLTLGE